MATSPEEMEDLAKIPGGLLINFGTLTSLEGMVVAGMDSPPLSFSQNSYGIKGKAQIKIESLLFSIQWVWVPHLFVSVQLQVRFGLS